MKKASNTHIIIKPMAIIKSSSFSTVELDLLNRVGWVGVDAGAAATSRVGCTGCTGC